MELTYSLFENSPVLQHLIDRFQAEQNVTVRLHFMKDMEESWSELMACAIYDRGPDVSLVGSTWVSSLAGMNALHPFTPADITDLGQAGAFLQPCWQSGILPGGQEIWSLPAAAYTFILVYRRDLLAKAGVPEAEAFKDIPSTARTLESLRRSGVEFPWTVPVSPHHLDTLHYVATWVWGRNGDLLSSDGKQVAFDRPEALAGFVDYFNLLKYMKKPAQPLDEAASLNLFRRGEAAVTIVGSEIAYRWLRSGAGADPVLQNLGFAPLPGVPWIGGTNVVVWRYTRYNPRTERSVVAFAHFLASQEVQRTRAAEECQLPTRLDALEYLPEQESNLTGVITRSLKTGRAYLPISIWSKIERQFNVSLGNIGLEILAGAGAEATVRKSLDELAKRFEIILDTRS